MSKTKDKPNMNALDLFFARKAARAFYSGLNDTPDEFINTLRTVVGKFYTPQFAAEGAGLKCARGNPDNLQALMDMSYELAGNKERSPKKGCSGPSMLAVAVRESDLSVEQVKQAVAKLSDDQKESFINGAFFYTINYLSSLVPLDLKAAQTLIDAGADVNWREGGVLCMASSNLNGDFEKKAEFLYSLGADFNLAAKSLERDRDIGGFWHKRRYDKNIARVKTAAVKLASG